VLSETSIKFMPLKMLRFQPFRHSNCLPRTLMTVTSQFCQIVICHTGIF